MNRRVIEETLLSPRDIRESMTVMTRSAPCRFLVLLLSLTSLCDVDAYPKSELQIEDGDGLEQELGESSWPFVPVDENDLVPRREEALQKIQEVIKILRLTFSDVAQKIGKCESRVSRSREI